MKALLTVNPNYLYEDYRVISPLVPPWKASTDPLACLSNLDSEFDIGELDELSVLDALEYIHPALVDASLQNWLGKVGHGGLVRFDCVDLREICLKFQRQEIDLNTVNLMIYGDQTNPLFLRRNALALNDLVMCLVTAGFTITKRHLYDGGHCRFILEGVRP